MNTMNNIFPITAVIALLLFLVKELLDLLKKRAERLRKIEAIKILLAEELEKNHWAFRSMFRILDEIRFDADSPYVKYHLEVSRNGNEHFCIVQDFGVSKTIIPKFSTGMYEKLLPTLAELDKSLFENVRKTYSDIFELVHYRDTLLEFFAGHNMDEDDRDQIREFLCELADERDDWYCGLNEGYKALTNHELKTWKLR